MTLPTDIWWCEEHLISGSSGAVSRVRVLVGRECEHGRAGICAPEAVEAAKRAAFAVERMRGETLTEYNNRKMSVALAAALEAITKEDPDE